MGADYQPGTVAVATVRGIEGVRVISCGKNGYHEFWWSPDYVIAWRQHEDRYVTDVRPLVVLDLEPIGEPRELVRMLRDGGNIDHTRRAIADQIESQTKPPRIPEPGPWGVVEAAWEPSGERFTFVRTARQGDADWQVTEDGSLAFWSDLIDPVLVREGVES